LHNAPIMTNSRFKTTADSVSGASRASIIPHTMQYNNLLASTDDRPDH